MRKVIAAINMTLDGYCDHTAIDPDEEVHEHYANLLKQASDILYGRVTYQLMEFWKTLIEKPSGQKSMDDFALVMNSIPKIVFSNTLKHLDWESARLATRTLQTEVLALKATPGKDLFVGSRSLIVQLLQSGLIDELQIMIHPVIAGNGFLLFKDINESVKLKLVQSKTFKSGAVLHYYNPVKSKLTDEH